MNEEMISHQAYDGSAEIRMARHPDTVIAEASLCAKALVRMVEKTKAYTVISGRKHLHFVAWQTLATMFRVTSRVVSTNQIEIDGVRGWECSAEAFHIPSNTIVSRADAMCTNDEPNWSMRPKYEWRNEVKTRVGEEPVPSFQLRAMAQTRACSKALRQVLSWVVVLAGYEAAAAEEMSGEADSQPKAAPQPTPMPAPRAANGTPAPANGALISEQQTKRLYALAMQAGFDKRRYNEFIEAYGYKGDREVERSRYEKMCQDLQDCALAGNRAEG